MWNVYVPGRDLLPTFTNIVIRYNIRDKQLHDARAVLQIPWLRAQSHPKHTKDVPNRPPIEFHCPNTWFGFYIAHSYWCKTRCIKCIVIVWHCKQLGESPSSEMSTQTEPCTKHTSFNNIPYRACISNEAEATDFLYFTLFLAGEGW